MIQVMNPLKAYHVGEDSQVFDNEECGVVAD